MQQITKKKLFTVFLGIVLVAILFYVSFRSVSKDPLPSWNEGATKQAILQFVRDVTREGGPYFIEPEERIATFDNDGTLWTSHPMYFQLFFVVDRISQLAHQHPEWKSTQPYKAVLENDAKAFAHFGEKEILEMVMATHAGMSTEEFEQIVKDWITHAKHPRFHRPFTDLVFQPMLELLKYLRANGFKTYIVSGGGVEFMRPWTEKVYGIPPEQVIGSSIKTKFEIEGGKPILFRLPEVNFIDDEEGKPIGINQYIGRRPVFAFGNADADIPMLEWTEAGKGKRFVGLVHHTDAAREYAYDRDTSFGRLDRGLDEAKQRGWTVVDMKKDWKVIYPFEQK